MTCTQCRHEFCWLCLKPWKNHTSCNAIVRVDTAADSDDEVETEAEDFDDKKRRSVIYLRYWDRYAVHASSQRLEGKLRAGVEEKALALELKGYHPKSHASSEEGTAVSEIDIIDTSYLIRACKTLINCRRTLKFTYIHAFYLQNNLQELSLFENMQGALEDNTEKLAELLERHPGQRQPILHQMDVSLARQKRIVEWAEQSASILLQAPASSHQ